MVKFSKTKQWRKNVDITDIEEQLEESRKEEMFGYVKSLISYSLLKWEITRDERCRTVF